MATRFCDLPEKAVVEIMSWLPPESLVHCKCVQKSWFALIDTLIESQWFVAKHLKNFGSRPSFVFITGEWGQQLTRLNFIMENQLLTSGNVCNENDEIHFNTQLLTRTSRPCGVEVDYCTSYCNGIIFQIENKTNKIMLCNPTTREFRHLDPNLSFFFGSEFKTFMSGFGYDAIDNVYKVVRVVIPPSNGGIRLGAEVCTLGSNKGNSSWREISMIDIGKYIRTRACCVMYYRGFIYWLLCNVLAATERMMISFDVHEEEFQVVPFPSGIADDPMDFETVDGRNRVAKARKGVSLSFWSQCPTLLKIIIITDPWDADIPKPVEVWKMKTDSSSCGHERFSGWVKHITLFPPLERFIPLLFWNNDLLFLHTVTQPHYNTVVTYNLRTQKVRTVWHQPLTVFMFSFSTVVCVKSLISINNYL